MLLSVVMNESGNLNGRWDTRRIIIVLSLEVKGRCKILGSPVAADSAPAQDSRAPQGAPGYQGQGQAAPSGGSFAYSGGGVGGMNGSGYPGGPPKMDPGGPGGGPRQDPVPYRNGAQPNGAGPPPAVASIGNAYGGGGYGGGGSAYGAPGSGTGYNAGGSGHGQGGGYSNGYGPPVRGTLCPDKAKEVCVALVFL